MAQRLGEDSSRNLKIVLCVALSAFNYQIEGNMVNVALPSIAADFSGTTSEVSFVVLAYLFGAAASFLPASWLAARYGIDRVFRGGCLIITLGAVLCYLAPSLELLILSRLLQGSGAGCMAALGYAIIPVYLSRDKTTWGYGWVSTGAGVGMMAGAPLGGLLAEFFSWRGIFLVAALPLGILIYMVFHWLPPDPAAVKKKVARDIPGVVFFAGSLGAGILFLSWGQELGWSSIAALGLLATSILLWLAAVRKRSACSPLFSPVVLANRTYMTSQMVVFFTAVCSAGNNFVMPFYLNQSCGLTPVTISIVLLAGSVAYITGAQVSRQCTARLDNRLLLAAGLTAAAVSFLLFLLSLPLGGWVPAALFLFTFSLIRGLYTPANNALALETVEADQRSEAASLIPLTLTIGGLLGVSIFDTLFSLEVPAAAMSLPILAVKPANGMVNALSFAGLLLGWAAWLIWRLRGSLSKKMD